MKTWTTNQDGLTANCGNESRLISAITVEDTILPFPPLTSAQIQEKLKESAQAALDKSDVTMLRCVEAGVTAPVEWNTYRKVLRGIATGRDKTSTILPTQPAYPAGT